MSTCMMLPCLPLRVCMIMIVACEEAGACVDGRTRHALWRQQRSSLRTEQAYDQHLNMILGDVEETITSIEIDEETYEEIVKTRTREAKFLFVRGDGVVVVGCQARSFT